MHLILPFYVQCLLFEYHQPILNVDHLIELMVPNYVLRGTMDDMHQNIHRNNFHLFVGYIQHMYNIVSLLVHLYNVDLNYISLVYH